MKSNSIPDTKPETSWKPRQIILFSGHMVDEPGRAVPRFPANKVDIAATHIAQALENLQAGPDDLALTQGACGGDLLFTQACLARGVRVQWLQPFVETTFIQESILCGGDSWLQIYLETKAQLTFPLRSAPDELGELPKETNAYERCNQWLLNTALAFGPEKVRFVCLWNGSGGGLGGTGHMVKEVERCKGQVIWIDTRKIFA
jgi:hypothetical protein